jgi:hypothetical protein
MLCKNASLNETPSEIPNTVITLDLSYNAISDLTASTFSKKGMSQLTSLYVYNNKIHNINRNAFTSLKNLKSIFMGDNKITYIHPETFMNSTDLEELDLHGNNIILTDNGPFHHLVNLFSLNLASCNLSRIPNATFQKTVKLSKLDVSSNKLTYVDDHLFDNLNSLKFLNLSGNLLTSVNFLLVLSTRRLQEISLYVYKNKLANLTGDVLKRMGVLKTLDMHQNPLTCRCWDRNLPLGVLQQCSEYKNYSQIYVLDCSNKTAPVAPVFVTEVVTVETKSTESSVPEELDFEIHENETTIISRDYSVLNVSSNDLNIVTDAPIPRNLPEDIPRTDVIIVATAMSVTLVIFVAVIVMCFFLSKETTSVSDERDFENHQKECDSDNHQQERQCQVCRIYQNYTPICDHKNARQIVNTSKKNALKFAIQQYNLAVLEAYETLTREGYEESCLYVPLSEDNLRHMRNCHSDCTQSSPVPTKIPCDKEIKTGTSGVKHSSFAPENHEDIVWMCVENTSVYESAIATFPRHSWTEHSTKRVASYMTRPPQKVHWSGMYRHSSLERPQHFYSQSCLPTSESTPVPRRQRRTHYSPRQMNSQNTCDLFSGRQIPSESCSLSTEHLYEELK